MLEAIHGGRGERAPVRLGEDFCGSGALSRRWVASQSARRATCCDLDGAALAKLKGIKGIRAVKRDVIANTPPLDKEAQRADVLFVGNFSIGYIFTRAALVRYLKRCRSRLQRSGVLVIDTYGGATSFVPGALKRKIKLGMVAAGASKDQPSGEAVVHYTWQQQLADPLTGMVTNALHFRVAVDGQVVADLPDAFVYHWRLWSVPELREAMAEVGLRKIKVFAQVPTAKDEEGNVLMRPVSGADAPEPGEDGELEPLDESFAVLVAGYK